MTMIRPHGLISQKELCGVLDACVLSSHFHPNFLNYINICKKKKKQKLKVGLFRFLDKIAGYQEIIYCIIIKYLLNGLELI